MIATEHVVIDETLVAAPGHPIPEWARQRLAAKAAAEKAEPKPRARPRGKRKGAASKR